MTDQHPTWSADWPQRLGARLRELGFETIVDFLNANPGLPYLKAAERLGPWVAAMQIQRAQMDFALKHKMLRIAAMDALAREINDAFPNGWSAEPIPAAKAYAHWTTLLTVQAKSPELQEKTMLVFKELEALSPQTGWRPTGIDDELIRRVFQLHWPE